MRIAIFSDPHMGFGYGTERYEDSFDAFAEALSKSKGCDLLLIAGDIFDGKNPTTDCLSKAMELLLDFRMSGTGARLAEGMDRRLSVLSPANSMGVPVVALHGNHERRAKGLVNPVQALEKAGLLIHMHCNGLVFEKEGERVAVQGMSAVPDQYARDVLKQWDPKPVRGAFNILMLHQVFSEFFQAPGSLPASAIPDGFSLYIDGDIHRPQKASCSGRPFIIAGSLIPTQQGRDETAPKGLWFASTSSGSVEFMPLECQRKFYFLEYKSPDRGAIERDIDGILSAENAGHKKKPAIRVKILGSFEWQEDIVAKYAGRALVSFRRDAESQPMQGVALEEHIASVEETAARLLRGNLEQAGLPPQEFEHIFELLAEKRHEDALKAVKEAARKVRPSPERKREAGDKNQEKTAVA